MFLSQCDKEEQRTGRSHKQANLENSAGERSRISMLARCPEQTEVQGLRVDLRGPRAASGVGPGGANDRVGHWNNSNLGSRTALQNCSVTVVAPHGESVPGADTHAV